MASRLSSFTLWDVFEVMHVLDYMVVKKKHRIIFLCADLSHFIGLCCVISEVAREVGGGGLGDSQTWSQNSAL